MKQITVTSKTSLREITTVSVAVLALILSGVTFYFQFLHKPSSLLVTVDNILITRPTYNVSPDDVTFVPQFSLTFINNGKRNIAVTEVSGVFSTNEKLNPGISIHVDDLAFAIEPGEVSIKNVTIRPSCELDIEASGYTICGENSLKFREQYFGLSFVIITDDGNRIDSKFIISKIHQISVGGHHHDIRYKVFNLVTKEKLNSKATPINP